MNLFDSTLLDDALRLKGADYCFFKQLAQDDGSLLRRQLEGIAAIAGAELTTRWREQLNSLNNRRFFQGFAEAMATHTLHRAGWVINALDWPGPLLCGQTPMDNDAEVIVLSFIQQVRPSADVQSIARLVRTLNRVDARIRIGIYVQRWLPHDFDPEPVRRAVELWLRDVQRHGSTDRYAVYEDEHIALEFALTQERTKRGQSIVSFSIGPFSGQKTLERVERKIVKALDHHSATNRSEQPALLCCVTEQPWRVSPGWIREMLYGKPHWQRQVNGDMELGYRDGLDPSLFRNPQYRSISAIMLIDRPVGVSANTRAKAYLNPWATHPFTPRHMDLMPTFSMRAREGREIVMGWSREAASLSNPGI